MLAAMGEKAARVDDEHICPQATPPSTFLCFSWGSKPHIGGPIQKGSDDVLVNGKKMARGGDPALCKGVGSMDYITTGAAEVRVNNQPAARESSKLMHAGATLNPGTLSDDVLIGGASGGAIVGNRASATEACVAAQDGRGGSNVGKNQQKWPNSCGCEAVRQIANTKHAKDETYKGEYGDVKYPMTEDQVLNESGWKGRAKMGSANESGLTNSENRNDMLDDHGVEATEQPQDMDAIAQNVADGKGVITAHDAGSLYGQEANNGGHVVIPTAIEYDADGNPKTVYVNDTNQGTLPDGTPRAGCGKAVPAGDYKGSLRPQSKMNVTKDQVWK
jgi:uncharacterized Zn-binding protein involved in type VI secretion